MSALGHKQTSAASFDQLVGERGDRRLDEGQESNAPAVKAEENWR